MNQQKKDTIREEFEELTKEPIGRDEAGNEYSIWDVVYNHDKDQTEVGVMITDWWLNKIEEAYQQGAKDKMEEVREQYKSDIEQLKLVHQLELQAISCKSLEDFVRWSEHSRQSLKDNT
jgi:hypothetical protein